MNFKELGLIPPILSALEAFGYQSPSPIQEKAIPPALEGRDVLGCARTGTGKTCAFAAPILQRLSAQTPKGRPIRALILTPTRELALQIGESINAYSKNLTLRSTVIFGGVGQAPQVSQLKQGVDILTATPGRLLDLLEQGFVDLSKLEIFVLDEADRMLDMGFIHDVRRVLKVLPAKKQTLFFSATMPPEVTDLVNELLHDPARVAADPVSSPVEVIHQQIYMVDRVNKTKLLAKLVSQPEVKSALVFSRTKHGANKVTAELSKLGITAAAIHGNKSQGARQQALADFKDGRLKVLVATDIAARGIDIEELSHVVNYNLPDVPETYIHRIGRTGRAGRGGTAISFCDVSERDMLKAIERLLGRPVPALQDPEWPMEVFDVQVKDAKGRPVNPEDAEARAAARDRRRERLAQAKPTAQSKAPAEKPVKEKAAPAVMSKPKEKSAAPKSESAQADGATEDAKKRRRKKKRAPMETILNAAVPEQATETAGQPGRRPDPLSGSIIMDATARMLAPRPRPAAPARDKEPKRSEKPRGGAEKSGFEARRPQGARPANRPDRGRGGRSRGDNMELRNSRQKDSTEQPSLMKPYYVERD